MINKKKHKQSCEKYMKRQHPTVCDVNRHQQKKKVERIEYSVIGMGEKWITAINIRIPKRQFAFQKRFFIKQLLIIGLYEVSSLDNIISMKKKRISEKNQCKY